MSLFMKNFHTGNPFAEFASQFGIEGKYLMAERGVILIIHIMCISPLKVYLLHILLI